MEVRDAIFSPPPKDRIIMVIDARHGDGALWEFALWDDEAHYDWESQSNVGGWCVSDHESLRWSIISGETAGVAQSVIDAPTHWSPVPPVPLFVDDSEK